MARERPRQQINNFDELFASMNTSARITMAKEMKSRIEKMANDFETIIEAVD